MANDQPRPANRYVAGQKLGYREQKITVPANGFVKVDLPESRFLWFHQMVTYQTSAGEIEAAFGTDGDFFDVSPGNWYKCGPDNSFGLLYLHNKTGVPKDLSIFFSNDPGFLAGNSPTGL